MISTRRASRLSSKWGDTVEERIENTRARTAEQTLKNRRDAFKIPPLPFAPKFDRVILFRLNQENVKGEKISAGGIIIAADVAEKHTSADPRAVVLAAGLGARDTFRSHDIRLGDIVWPARFSGWEPETVVHVGIKSERKASMLFVLDADVTGSIDSLWREENGEVEVAYDSKTGRHYYVGEGRQDPQPLASVS